MFTASTHPHQGTPSKYVNLCSFSLLSKKNASPVVFCLYMYARGAKKKTRAKNIYILNIFFLGNQSANSFFLSGRKAPRMRNDAGLWHFMGRIYKDTRRILPVKCHISPHRSLYGSLPSPRIAAMWR